MTASNLGMTTTAGSWAFVGAKASKNSAVAQLLIDAGLIIIGKGNMTVWTESAQQGFYSLTGGMTGVCRHENDNDDAGMVQPRGPNTLSICGENRRE